MDWIQLSDELVSLVITAIVIYLWRRTVKDYRQLVDGCRDDLKLFVGLYGDKIRDLKEFRREYGNIIQSMAKTSNDIKIAVTEAED